MNKEFLAYGQIRNNAIKLAHRIHLDGFVPDVLYVSLRGGAYMGNVISEYFKIVRRGHRPTLYAALVAHSYVGVGSQQTIRIDGWTYAPEHLRNGDKVLLVDDIFDSGRTIQHVVSIILAAGVPREDIRIAVHDYKLRPDHEPGIILPDYWCRQQAVTPGSEETWVHYLSHELVGLSEAEIRAQYADDPDVVQILLGLRPS